MDSCNRLRRPLTYYAERFEIFRQNHSLLRQVRLPASNIGHIGVQSWETYRSNLLVELQT